MDTSYCLCGRPYDPEIFMIQCDVCKDWFHGSCCNFQEHVAIEIDKYHCPRCSPIVGPSLYKPIRNYHRHDYWDENAHTKPVQTGTEIFIRELQARHFSNESDIVIHMRGQQLTETLLLSQGFDCPIVVDGKDGLDMTVPPNNFSVYDVESYIGGDYEMDVIDVTRQTDIKMKLSDFVAYYNSLNRSRVFNVVSLEFSKTSLSKMVEAPLVARRLDWVNMMWPVDYPCDKPHVQKYCLMSVKDSYTDFHIDFGGTSVWYHILRGEKIFYLIKPTSANLTLYQQWMTSSNQQETFFGDQVDECFKCTLRQGQTMLIPTGWIHAVLTPIDSLVFGGNFLHSLNIPMQLHVYDIEKKIKTAPKFLYPDFEKINWFAAQRILLQISELNVMEQECPRFLIFGIKTLVSYLKQWNTDKDYNTYSRDQIPVGLNVSKLFKDITKEIRHAERVHNTLDPPKPERESKRKRKKPVNKDFLDYSSSKASLKFMTSEKMLPLNSPKPASLKLTLTKNAFLTDEQMTGEHCGIDELNLCANREETTAIHRGGTVLKIKLGAKDIIPVETDSQIDDDMLLPHMSKSIYDFHDDSEREEDCPLEIDESYKRRKTSPGGGLKIKLASICGSPIKREPNVDVESDVPKNGIESLLKASALTNKFSTLPTSVHTSPSTEEAIAGMLSIGQTCIQSNKSAKSRKYQKHLYDEDDELNNAHQDEDYVYPSLDNSDEDDIHIFKPRGRSKIDEPWNPKARVGPLLPKMNRPAREGTKKQAVEKVLEAAAKKPSNEYHDKMSRRQYRKKRVKSKIPEKVIPANTLSLPGTSQCPPGNCGTVSFASAPNNFLSTQAEFGQVSPVLTPSMPKPRKGMKTVKQRLGKILKLHKMRH